MSTLSLQRTPALNSNRFLGRSRAQIIHHGLRFAVRYAYYAFIFSIPFEGVDIGIGGGSFTLAKMIGYIFMAATLLQPNFAFKRPPRAFWCFVIYLFVLAIFGVQQAPIYHAEIIVRFLSLTQMIILFWISYTLMQHERIAEGALLTLTVSIVSLATLLTFGLIGEMIRTTEQYERTQALGVDPNTLAAIISLGVLAVVGLTYERKELVKKARLLVWPAFGILIVALIKTGSRGPLAALMAALLTFLLKGEGLGKKLKAGFVVLLAVGSLSLAAYQSEAFRLRWEKTLNEGSLAGRERIYPDAWAMFLEKPLTGWGPGRHLHELGERTGDFRGVDTHNLYLYILTETGIMGAIPFFLGMWRCLQAAWKARYGTQGILPCAMLICVLIVNMSITWDRRKLYWFVLAYALASASYAALPKLRKVPPRPYCLVRH